ncbi:TIGR02679 family protein [Streptomyces monashensis]|uniref:TIGR02679 family protein n=1 Tax=Streptomyces monashensis TaxID=1678012 RepID=A0A1S2PV22_9ACTN|nr:TIGR02679 family protein [Streptomyces monashensis]OIJ97356.1 TIGR02679 family protein [Streptomyces monashensis]
MTEKARVDTGRLQRLLGADELAWLVERARRRMAREEPLTGPVTLTAPTPAQRAAAERLLGRSPGAGLSLTLRLDAVDAVLRRSGISPDGLAPALIALGGPVAPLRDAREREERAWEAAYAPLADLSGTTLADWSDRLPRDGLVRRLAGDPDTAAALVAKTVRTLSALPAEPPCSLAAFAARTLGDAHALDDGRPLATLVLLGVRALTGYAKESGAQGRRDAWAAAGLLKDDVSSTVLTLGLRGTPALDWHTDAGEPAVLTLRQLVVRGPLLPHAALHVCENPAVVSQAADTYGPNCPPLVCLQGQPSAAALTLLRQAHAQGLSLHYHGDFDWGGARIAATLLRHVPWHPWRYRADDYRRAATHPGLPLLAGAPAATPWDPELASALKEFGVRVEEEVVLDELIADLGAA